MEVIPLAVDPEIQERFEEQDDRIGKVEKEVSEIKNNQIHMDEKIRDLKDTMVSYNSNVLQSINTNNQLMSQMIINMNDNRTQKEVAIVNNETQLQITKENNKSGLYDKILTFAGKLLLVVAAFFGGSKASDIWVAIKEIFR